MRRTSKIRADSRIRSQDRGRRGARPARRDNENPPLGAPQLTQQVGMDRRPNSEVIFGSGLSILFILAGALQLIALSVWGGSLPNIHAGFFGGHRTAGPADKAGDSKGDDADIGHEAGSAAGVSEVEKRLEELKKRKIVRIVEVALTGALDEAKKDKIIAQLKEADSKTIFVLSLSSSSGEVAAVHELSEALRRSPANTVGFVRNRALGETALLAISCDVIVMGVRSRLGALAVDQYSAVVMGEDVRETHIEKYRAAAKDNEFPRETVAAFVDAGIKLQVKSDVVSSLESWERDGMEGRNPGSFLWVGPTAAHKLGVSAATVIGPDVRKVLGFQHLPLIRDGKKVDPVSDDDTGGLLKTIRLERVKPVDALKLVKGVKRIYVLKIDGVIDMGLAPFVKRIVGKSRPTDLLVLDVDTFGGRVDAAVAIRDSLLKSKAPTLAFVNRRAISAGALISLACDLIVMTPGGSMGAATPVQISGGETKPTDEKVVSYMRKEMKSTGEAKGRRGDIAEAMVDRDVDVKGIPHALKETISGLQKGKLLTLTTEEALALGMVDMKAETLDEIFKKLEIEDVPVKKAGINWAEEIARFLTNPMVAGILMSIGMLGILIELFTPGVGLPGAIGVACLLLFFMGHFVADLAGWEHAILFIVGLALLVVEIFITPGFGVLGTVGGLAVLASLVMAMIGTKSVDFDTALALGLVTRAVAITVGSILVAAFLGFFAVRYLPETGFFNKLVLQGDKKEKSSRKKRKRGLYMEAPEMVADSANDKATSGPEIGERGIARTVLRPAGKVKFGDKTYSATAHGEYIGKGDRVELTRKEAGRFVVRLCEPEPNKEEAQLAKVTEVTEGKSGESKTAEGKDGNGKDGNGKDGDGNEGRSAKGEA